MTKNIGQNFRIYQLNIESISKSKCQYFGKILKESAVNILLIQEVHLENDDQARSRTKIPGYDIIGITIHTHYCNISYARNTICVCIFVYILCAAERSCSNYCRVIKNELAVVSDFT